MRRGAPAQEHREGSTLSLQTLSQRSIQRRGVRAGARGRFRFRSRPAHCVAASRIAITPLGNVPAHGVAAARCARNMDLLSLRAIGYVLAHDFRAAPSASVVTHVAVSIPRTRMGYVLTHDVAAARCRIFSDCDNASWKRACARCRSQMITTYVFARIIPPGTLVPGT